MAPHKLFRPRRIGVCGSSKDLSPEAVLFCEAVGTQLAKETKVVIVSGGTRTREDAQEGDLLAADWHIVKAAEQEITMHGGLEQVVQQIETVVSDDTGENTSFHIGSSLRARGKTRETRRFSFVRSLDALLAVAGRGGAAQSLALAMELGMPVLPVPLFDGAAKELWRAYKNDLTRTLRLDEATVERWEAPIPTDPSRLQELACEMVKALLDNLPRRCFVIMPFLQDFVPLYDFVIEPAIKNAGDQPIRLDRTAVPGNVGNQIHDGIRYCDYVIAVLDGLRANVLYELGFAHGYGKPTVLLNRIGTLGDAGVVPFDLSMHQRLEYDIIEASLLERLGDTLATLPNRRV